MCTLRHEILTVTLSLCTFGLVTAQSPISAPYDRPAGFAPGTSVNAPPINPLINFANNGYLGLYGNGAGYPYLGNPWMYGPNYVSSYPYRSVFPPIPDPIAVAPSVGPKDPILPLQYLSSAAARLKQAETTARLNIRTAVTVYLPAPGTVWEGSHAINAKPAKEVVVDASKLPPGATRTLHLRATWNKKGQEFEYLSNMDVELGDTKSLTILAGNPIPAR